MIMMKNLRLLVVLVGVTLVAAPVAPAQVIDENFDSLDVGTNMHNVEGWEGWYGNESAGGYVTADQAYSGNHSLEFARPVDLVPHWERKTSGTWILTTMQYVPSTATTGRADYAVLSDYVGGAEWIATVISDFENDVVILDGLDPEPELPLVRDAWAEIRVEVDLDAQVSNFYYNGELLGTHGADQTTGLEAIDLWANSDDVIYFDDFSLVVSPEPAIFKGDVWSFPVEPFAYPMAAEKITATASSSFAADEGPENTIDNSGLDANNLHSTEKTDMWLSSGEPNAWIEYEFDKAQKLHEMWVWNSNQGMELGFGFGFKDVKIEYSTNGTDYTTLAGVPEFVQASGTADYAHDTTVDLEGVTAKYVRLTANSSWGPMPQSGLSEVRFFSISVYAREPDPDSGAADVDVEATLSWRAGRDAAEHDVYLSTDEQAVIDGTAPVDTVTETSYSSPLDVGSTYYWRVDEVNDAETWQGEIWNFSTPDYFVVDDFESYNEIPDGEEGSNLVYEKWADGYDNPLVNGSIIGHFRGDTLEYSTVYDGKQSAPLYYNNSTASLSEVTVDISDLAIGSDWTIGSPQALVLWVHGAIGNAPEQMYVKVGSAKVLYDGDITEPMGRQWSIDLAGLGIDLSDVTQLSIGLERIGATGGSGRVIVDAIRLYKEAIPLPSEEIWIEAEAATTIEAPMMIFDDPAASGGQYIMLDPDADQSTGNPPDDGLVTYTFTVAGGTYKIAGRVISIGSSDSFWVQIPSATTQTNNHSSGWVRWNGMTIEGAWGWHDIWSQDDGNATVEFTMPAGTHTLEIRYRERATQLDALVITSID